MRGAVIDTFYQSPLPASSSSSFPSLSKRKWAPAEANAVAISNPSALQRETRLLKRRLVTPGTPPIAAAARSAPATTWAADPRRSPWATRARSAAGGLLNRGKLGPGAGMVADPAKANEQAAPIAPNVASANTVFRIESLRCLRRGDDSRVAARQKEAELFAACGKTRDSSLSTCHLAGLAFTLRACKLDSIDQGIRGD